MLTRLLYISLLLISGCLSLQAQRVQTDSPSYRLPLPDVAVQGVQAQVPQQDALSPPVSVVQINADELVVAVDSVTADTSVLLNEEPEAIESVEQVQENLRIPLSKIFWSIIVFVIGYFFIRFTTKLLELFAERSTGHRITIKGLVPIVRIVGWVVVITIVIAGVIAPKIETLWALTASVGVAVGFASQDILKNIFGGIMILLDTPFKVGDKIEIGSFYGEVVEIGLRSTRIVTPDDSLVSIPNGELMNQSVSNSNAGELNCQVVAEIFLPLEIDTEAVRRIATEAAQTSKYVYLNKGITVLFFNEIKEKRSYLKMRLKAYVMDIRYEFIFKSELTEIVVRELLREGIIRAEDFR